MAELMSLKHHMQVRFLSGAHSYLTFVLKLVIFTPMIKMLKYYGYEDDGVEGYQCLNCHNHISMRHHAFSITIDYCPFCGCKFEGGFIKDNKYKFYRKDEYGYFRSVLYKMYEKEYRYKWSVEKFSTTYCSYGDIHDIIPDNGWEEVHTFGFDYNAQKSQRENELLQLRKDMKNEMEESVNSFYEREEIEFRLKYCKYYHSQKEKEQDIRYYYPKNNKIIKKQKQRKKVSA
jgi:hypothetical protein